MLLEERAMIGSTSIALAVPGAPVLTVRSPGTGETSLPSGDTVWVRVTALNYYGETIPSTSALVAVGTSGAVVDVAVVPVPGALAYNIYVGVGASDPGAAASFLMVAAAGGARITLQGTIPIVGPVPPTADTGTAASTD